MRILFLVASIGSGLMLPLISNAAIAQIPPPSLCAQAVACAQSVGPSGYTRDTVTGVITGPNGTPPTQPPTTVPVIKSFGGLSFGVGVGATFDTEGQKRVASATVVNNIVRINQTDNATVSLVGESHYFFIPNMPFFGVPAGDWGTGPFVAIDAGQNNNGNIISGYSIGWMIGFRQISWGLDPSGRTWVPTYSSTNSWNFGVGFRVDPNAQTLGDGVIANMPLPPGETTVRLKTQARYGIMLLSSFSF